MTIRLGNGVDLEVGSSRAVPLCVDLDGTLVDTDMLIESVIACARRMSAWSFLALLLRSLVILVISGKAAFKLFWSQQIGGACGHLPVNTAVLEVVGSEIAKHRNCYLVTACEQGLAEAVAEHLKATTGVVFSGVHGSVQYRNLRGRTKAQFLVGEFGEGGFDYIGDSRVDFPVWAVARKVIVATRSHRFWQEVQARFSNSEVIFSPAVGSSTFLKQLRVHQWVKNLLIFVPALMAHSLFQLPTFFSALVAFVAFSSMASAVYILNDLIDLEADRTHPTKRFRPLAAGTISVPMAVACIPGLLLVSGMSSLFLPLNFAILLLGYFCLTCSYSISLKRVPILDIIVLAGLYALRVLAGAVGTNTTASPWLLTFSLFMFLSLACAKRFSELHRCSLNASEAIAEDDETRLVPGRGYFVSDKDMIGQSGIAAGFGAVLVMALYINSSAVRVLYTRPQVLWLLGPLVLYWILRVWFIAHRGQLNEDPIVFALRDKASYLVAVLSFLVLGMAI